jgi:hypothetical protein
MTDPKGNAHESQQLEPLYNLLGRFQESTECINHKDLLGLAALLDYPVSGSTKGYPAVAFT